MKQPKRLTRDQKEIIKNHGYNWKEYGFRFETDIRYMFINKETGRLLSIRKE